MRPLEKPTRWAEAVVVLLLALLLGMTGLAFAQSPSGRAVVILEVRGLIDPVVAQYVKQGLDTANHTDIPLVIIRLDTPGGLDIAMRDIVQAILNSDVPVAVFVEPSGACAASAGVFMTMAAHVAAMAPGTNIGAAHPVALGDQGELEPRHLPFMAEGASELHFVAGQSIISVCWIKSGQAMRIPSPLIRPLPTMLT